MKRTKKIAFVTTGQVGNCKVDEYFIPGLRANLYIIKPCREIRAKWSKIKPAEMTEATERQEKFETIEWIKWLMTECFTLTKMDHIYVHIGHGDNGLISETSKIPIKKITYLLSPSGIMLMDQLNRTKAKVIHCEEGGQDTLTEIARAIGTAWPVRQVKPAPLQPSKQP